MSFAVSLDDGALEYGGDRAIGRLFAQTRNLLRPRFWSMLRDLLRFYRDAPGDLRDVGDGLHEPGRLSRRQRGYGAAFHRGPSAADGGGDLVDARQARCATIPPRRSSDSATITVCCGSPAGRNGAPSTAAAGHMSQRLTARLCRSGPARPRACAPIAPRSGRRCRSDAMRGGETGRFDHVVIAAHADQALAMLADPSPDGEPRCSARSATARNEAVLHQRRRADAAAAARSGRAGTISAHAPATAAGALRHLLDEPPAMASPKDNRCSSRSTRSSRRAADSVIRSRNLRTSGVRRGRDPRPARAVVDCRASAAPGSAAPISAPAFMRTGCRRASPSPRRSAASGAPGRCPMNPGASIWRRPAQPRVRRHDGSAIYRGTVAHRRLRPRSACPEISRLLDAARSR